MIGALLRGEEGACTPAISVGRTDGRLKPYRILIRNRFAVETPLWAFSPALCAST
jgi:hypothetical protein